MAKGLKKDKKPKTGITDKQKVFAEAYCINGFHKTNAAITSGTTNIVSARSMGAQMYAKPEVRKYIDGILAKKTASLEEIVGIVNNVAVSNLSDYFKPIMVEYSEKTTISLSEYIDRQRKALEQRRAFGNRITMEKDRLKRFEAELQSLEEDIISLEVELEFNPKAFRIVSTPTVLKQKMVLDIDKVVEDKEKGRIKSLKYDKYGRPEIELYSAQDAADKILKMKGAYEKDNRQKAEQVKQVIMWAGKALEIS